MRRDESRVNYPSQPPTATWSVVRRRRRRRRCPCPAFANLVCAPCDHSLNLPVHWPAGRGAKREVRWHRAKGKREGRLRPECEHHKYVCLGAAPRHLECTCSLGTSALNHVSSARSSQRGRFPQLAFGPGPLAAAPSDGITRHALRTCTQPPSLWCVAPWCSVVYSRLPTTRFCSLLSSPDPTQRIIRQSPKSAI